MGFFVLNGFNFLEKLFFQINNNQLKTGLLMVQK